MFAALQPIRRNPSRQRVAQGFSLPAPVGGLNAVDSITDMDEKDALVLENWFPEPSEVRIRRGFEAHATGISGAVTSLMEWAGPATRKLFGANTSAIYNVSSPGAVGAADLSGLSNGRWQHTMMATSGGNFLVICNGADSVRNYDGTSWTTPAITNVTSSTLSNVAVHKNRLWFVQVGTTDAWYLGINSISGAATKFPLGPLFSLGGRLVVIATWTRDGGSGPDDFIAFISSLGEIAVYQGSDPSDPDAWALVGVYRVGPPIGNRCVLRTGADLGVISKDGVVSLTRMIGTDRSASPLAAITHKISKLFNEDARAYDGNFGWQGLSYPRANQAIFNVPSAEGATSHQYVMNTITGAWCKFTNQNAGCWALFNDQLYFGGNDGVVYLADSGFQDDGEAISASMKTSFSYYKSRGRLKLFKMLRPIIGSTGSPALLVDMNVDFEDAEPTQALTPAPATGAVWDSALWDSGVWGSGETITRGWLGVGRMGMAAAIRLRASVNGASLTLHSFDAMAEVGGLA